MVWKAFLPAAGNLGPCSMVHKATGFTVPTYSLGLTGTIPPFHWKMSHRLWMGAGAGTVSGDHSVWQQASWWLCESCCFNVIILSLFTAPFTKPPASQFPAIPWFCLLQFLKLPSAVNGASGWNSPLGWFQPRRTPAGGFVNRAVTCGEIPNCDLLETYLPALVISNTSSTNVCEEQTDKRDAWISTRVMYFHKLSRFTKPNSHNENRNDLIRQSRTWLTMSIGIFGIC